MKPVLLVGDEFTVRMQLAEMLEDRKGDGLFFTVSAFGQKRSFVSGRYRPEADLHPGTSRSNKIRSRKMQCTCNGKDDLVDISQRYTAFVAGMRCLATADWVKLLQCPGCGQLWRTDEWDKYQPLYARKLDSPEGWESADMESLIKLRIVENHGGLDTSACLAKDCKQHVLKGRAYCVDHFYETGARG